MSNQGPAQMLLGALSVMGECAMCQHRHERDLAVEQLRAGALAHMVDAFVSRRVDAVKEGFLTILAGYAEQARHFMAQQQKYADAEIDATDPLRRIELRDRIQDIDHALSTLRIDAKLLFQNMSDVLIALGGSSAGFASELAQPLALTIGRA